MGVAREVHGALDAAIAVVEGGGSPLDAVRAFAAAAPGKLTDEAVAELEAGLRKVIAGLELVVAGAAGASTVLARPAVRQGIERLAAALPVVAGRAVDLGYDAGALRSRLRAWLDAPAPGAGGR